MTTITNITYEYRKRRRNKIIQKITAYEQGTRANSAAEKA